MSWEANGRPPFVDWPKVPGFDPENPRNDAMRYLYHQSNLTERQIEELEAKGWVPIDVRLMPDDDDADKKAQIKATMAGVRQGSIELNTTQLRMLSEEMKVFKLNKGDEAEVEVNMQDSEDLEQILELTGNSPQAKMAGRRFFAPEELEDASESEDEN